MKRILSVILTVVLVMGLVPANSVSAAENRAKLWINGSIFISEENAEDVLGDGTVSYDYATDTLTLNGANISGIIADNGDLNIHLTNTENVVYDKAGHNNAAIYAGGDIYISGNGTLSATGGEKYDDSYGIYTEGSITIHGADVTATGGDVILAHSDSYETSNAKSVGVYAEDGMVIRSNGILTAIGGKSKGHTAFSCGIKTSVDADIDVYDGFLYAESGVSDARMGTNSIAIMSFGDLNLLHDDAVVNAKGGYGKIFPESIGEKIAVVNSGIYILGGNLNIFGGKLQAYSEGNKDVTGYTHAIEVGASGEYNEKTDVTTWHGGNINIVSDNPENISVKASSLYGDAVAAGENLKLDKLLTISTPVSSRIKYCKFRIEYSQYYMWTVVDEAGELAKSVTIEAAEDVEFLAGDVNGDECLTAEDALAVLKHSAKLADLKGYGKIVADIEYDEKIDAEDALKILKKAARIDDWFER